MRCTRTPQRCALGFLAPFVRSAPVSAGVMHEQE
jgi:hypothetical protein